MLRRFVTLCLQPHCALEAVDLLCEAPLHHVPVVVADLYTLRHDADVSEHLFGRGGVLGEASLVVLAQEACGRSEPLWPGATIVPRVTLGLPVKPRRLAGVVSMLAGTVPGERAA